MLFSIRIASTVVGDAYAARCFLSRIRCLFQVLGEFDETCKIVALLQDVIAKCECFPLFLRSVCMDTVKVTYGKRRIT